jgi:predicted dehydrogenase/nucleoside-diphosphate-sugar epimerase
MARHHATTLKCLPVPAAIVGVHDHAPGAAEELAALAGCPSFSSCQAMLSEARPDVVHVCTPPTAHFEGALAALEGGAHVYVEKPFALRLREAGALLEVARARRRLVCSGHQLLRDPAFDRLLKDGAGLGTLVEADSHFAFRPVGLALARADAPTLGRLLVDILPHPLYSLVAVLERFAPAARINLEWAHAEPTDLQAVLRAGSLVGRLSVSLRARPVASSITLIGTQGSLSADFVRSMVVGAANTGTEPLEKLLNPLIEGSQLLWRSGLSVLRRLRSRSGYAGLPELMDAFYRAVATGGPSPLSPAHLLSVTALFEELVARIEVAAGPRPVRPDPRRIHDTPLVAVTGARGFLGAEVSRLIPRVRGIGRGSAPDGTRMEQWVAVDLSNGLGPEALAGAHVVVHAAAETSGGYHEHQRNTIDATGHLLRAMQEADVRRLVLVSSLSVLEPPRLPWERQDERTPRPRAPRRYGAYTWGKCLQEELVEREAAARAISTRIIRPGALIDWREPAMPGLMGRRVFGRWHLGMGRPGLPIAVCDVERCAAVIAWCAAHFDEAPPILNLFDPSIASRGDLVRRLRAGGGDVRMLWAPISLLAFGLTVVRAMFSMACGRRPERLAAWSILRPRRYDARLSKTVLEAVRADACLQREHALVVHLRNLRSEGTPPAPPRACFLRHP